MNSDLVELTAMSRPNVNALGLAGCDLPDYMGRPAPAGVAGLTGPAAQTAESVGMRDQGLDGLRRVTIFVKWCKTCVIVLLLFIPNPPKDRDGRREDSGRG